MFLENKYSKCYFNIIENAKNRVNVGYSERHHIIPMSLGGSNSKDNLVRLTAREHFIAHLLLTKMTVGKDLAKMKTALSFMTCGNKNREIYIPSSRIFEIVRIARAEGTRVLKQGVPLTPEHRLAVSKGLTGTKRKPRTPEEIESIRNGNLGKKRGPMSDEHKRKISAANKGRKMSAEARENIRKGWEARRKQCA